MTCFRSFIAAVIALATVASPASAQQKPLVIIGGQTRQLPAGTTLSVQPSTSGAASINIPQGTAPSSPSNGDCWTTAGGYFCRIAGATVDVTQANLAASGAGGVSGTLGITNGGTGATTATGATAALQFKNTGASTTTNSLATRLQAGYIYATDYMSAAQIADGTTRAGSIDVAAALNSCIADAVANGKTCFLPGGKWKASSAQIKIDYGPHVNSGGSFIGEGVSATVIDASANTANPTMLVTATGGSVGSPLSTTYGRVGGFNLQGSIAGAVLQIGLSDQSDQINQMNFYDISVQNFNASTSSSCGILNSIYSSTFSSVNCATAAGPNVANYLWIMRNTSFSTFTAFGGSNGGTELYITSGTSTGNVFVAWDCEVVRTCLKIDTSTARDNVWQSGTWSYNWSSTAGYGVSASAGTDNAVYHPNLNASSTGGATTFLSSGSGSYFRSFDSSSLATQGGDNNFTGTNSVYGTLVFNTGFTVGSGTAAFNTTPAFNAGLTVGSGGTATFQSQANFTKALQLSSLTYSTLPTCNSTNAGVIAYITDASAAITTWRQQVTAGGGANKAFVACNGSGWYAFDY